MNRTTGSRQSELNQPQLSADCSRCQGLCCVALSFESSEWFGFDKPSGVACRHLDGNHRCRIHGSLEERGFAGCAAYDCCGAGQRVSEELFPGRSWRDSAQTARAMFESLRVLRQLHELLLLLRATHELPLRPPHAAQRDRLLGCVEQDERALRAQGWADVDAREGEVYAFMRTLSEYVAPRKSRSRHLRVIR